MPILGGLGQVVDCNYGLLNGGADPGADTEAPSPELAKPKWIWPDLSKVLVLLLDHDTCTPGNRSPLA